GAAAPNPSPRARELRKKASPGPRLISMPTAPLPPRLRPSTARPMRGNHRSREGHEEDLAQDSDERRELILSSSGRRFLIALTAACLGSSSAGAAEPPYNVAGAVAQAAQACKDMDGQPNTDAVLTVEDLNGDGGEDWIADYSKLKCEGGVNPLCG